MIMKGWPLFGRNTKWDAAAPSLTLKDTPKPVI